MKSTTECFLLFRKVQTKQAKQVSAACIKQIKKISSCSDLKIRFVFFHTEHSLPRCTAGTVPHRQNFIYQEQQPWKLPTWFAYSHCWSSTLALKTNRAGMQSLSPVITLEIPQEGSSWCPLNEKSNFWNASKPSCSHGHLWTTGKTEKAEYFLSLRDTLGGLFNTLRRANTKVQTG